MFSRGARAPDSTTTAVVLLADDDADTRNLYRFCLTVVGFAVEEAANGREALSKAKALLPDVVVTDIALPDVDGFSLCRGLKRDGETAEIPIIAVTGYSSPGYRDRAQQAGFDWFLLKPVGPDDLVSVIREALQARRTACSRSQQPKIAATRPSDSHVSGSSERSTAGPASGHTPRAGSVDAWQIPSRRT